MTRGSVKEEALGVLGAHMLPGSVTEGFLEEVASKLNE